MKFIEQTIRINHAQLVNGFIPCHYSAIGMSSVPIELNLLLHIVLVSIVQVAYVSISLFLLCRSRHNLFDYILRTIGQDITDVRPIAPFVFVVKIRRIDSQLAKLPNSISVIESNAV